MRLRYVGNIFGLGYMQAINGDASLKIYMRMFYAGDIYGRYKCDLLRQYMQTKDAETCSQIFRST